MIFNRLQRRWDGSGNGGQAAALEKRVGTDSSKRRRKKDVGQSHAVIERVLADEFNAFREQDGL